MTDRPDPFDMIREHLGVCPELEPKQIERLPLYRGNVTATTCLAIGGKQLIVMEYFSAGEPMGWDIFVPIDESNDVQQTLEKLGAYMAHPALCQDRGEPLGMCGSCVYAPWNKESHRPCSMAAEFVKKLPRLLQIVAGTISPTEFLEKGFAAIGNNTLPPEETAVFLELWDEACREGWFDMHCQGCNEPMPEERGPCAKCGGRTWKAIPLRDTPPFLVIVEENELVATRKDKR